jgi:pullulanase
VVYNHTYFTKESVFNQTVPGYFYRQKTDGTFANASGCGNEMATERSMVRKYIIDSLKYWAEEYHIDGFRMDLMGVYDLDTMKAIREELDSVRPGIVLYGEGWTADASPMQEQQRAVKMNISQLPGTAAFNDDFRDALKGHHSNKKSKGFISGCGLREEPVKFGIVGAVYHPQIVYDYVEPAKHAWAGEPAQCINYVSCHDNYTLWDKLKLSCPEATVEELKNMVKLAGALILTSQGVPFLHSGVEFCRTKAGNGNSYKSSDSVNQLDWNRKQEFYDVFDYFRKLIILRKNHPAFSMASSELIRKHLNFFTDYKIGVVSYCISGEAVNDSWKLITVLFNGNGHETLIELPEGQFKAVVTGTEINENGIGDIVSESITVEKYSAVILVGI